MISTDRINAINSTETRDVIVEETIEESDVVSNFDDQSESHSNLEKHVEEKNTFIKKLQLENRSLKRVSHELKGKTNATSDVNASNLNLSSKIGNSVKRMIREKPYNLHGKKRIKKKCLRQQWIHFFRW